ncbi:MAG: ABC transporter permease [Propionibacteriales bacterium]|nr:ABC transporter permease [Propionibacteriales bacterium]
MTSTLAPVAKAPPRQPISSGSIPFLRLVKVELRKSTDTRAARWLLGVIAAVSVLVMAIPLIWDSTFDQRWSDYLGLGSVPLAVLLPVVSILTMTSEWTQRAVLVTFTQEPRRGRVFAAKVIVGCVLAALSSVFALGASAAALALSGALGRSVEWDGSEKLAAGFVLFLILNSLVGLGFAAVLHNSAAAIVLFFVIPTVWSILATTIGAMEDVGRWLDTGQTFMHVLASEWDGHTAQILASVAVWIVLPLSAGLVRTIRREVK